MWALLQEVRHCVDSFILIIYIRRSDGGFASIEGFGYI